MSDETKGQFGEPWHYAYEGSGQHSMYSGDTAVESFSQHEELTDEQAEAYCRRVIACVNFLAGVPTETLESARAEFDKLKAAGGNPRFEITDDAIFVSYDGVLKVDSPRNNMTLVASNDPHAEDGDMQLLDVLRKPSVGPQSAFAEYIRREHQGCECGGTGLIEGAVRGQPQVCPGPKRSE